MRFPRSVIGLFFVSLLVVPLRLPADPVGTAFTYQGRLDLAGVPANGVFDFHIALWDADEAGTMVAEIDVADVPVTGGLFTLDLDFGALAWDFAATWLEIGVRPDGGGAFSTLAGRQRVRPAPLALHSMNVAAGAVGTAEIDANEVQRRVSQTCAAGSSIRTIALNGSVVCETDNFGTWVEPAAGSVGTAANFVGINTISPQATLHVLDSGTTRPAILIEGATFTEGDIAWPLGEALNLGTWDEASQTGDALVGIDSNGRVSVDGDLYFDDVVGDKISLFGDRFGQASMYGFGVLSGTLTYKANGAHSFFIGDADATTAAPSMHLVETGLGIGTTNLGTYRLAVDGSIRSKEIVVETGWSDFVFEPDYPLRPLAEVSAFIAAHGHLPDVPGAAEVAANGVPVGEMTSTLLRKVEELTLYLLALDREVQDLRAENARLAGARP